MPATIIIVGGVADAPTHAEFLARLRAEVSESTTWVWIECTAESRYRPRAETINPVLDQLGKWRAAARRHDPSLPDKPRVVKLAQLHGKTANQFFQVWPDPILAPITARTATEIIDFLKSADAGLFPPQEWLAGAIEAALVAIVCKLIKKKSISGGYHSHSWTLEEHLLNDAPVANWPAVAREARQLLGQLDGNLLITKGSSQGQTPKGWAINARILPLVKKALVSRSVELLRAIQGLDGLLDGIAADPDRVYRLDGDVVSERILAFCRER